MFSSLNGRQRRRLWSKHHWLRRRNRVGRRHTENVWALLGGERQRKPQGLRFHNSGAMVVVATRRRHSVTVHLVSCISEGGHKIKLIFTTSQYIAVLALSCFLVHADFTPIALTTYSKVIRHLPFLFATKWKNLSKISHRAFLVFWKFNQACSFSDASNHKTDV